MSLFYPMCVGVHGVSDVHGSAGLSANLFYCSPSLLVAVGDRDSVNEASGASADVRHPDILQHGIAATGAAAADVAALVGVAPPFPSAGVRPVAPVSAGAFHPVLAPHDIVVCAVPESSDMRQNDQDGNVSLPHEIDAPFFSLMHRLILRD